jgi:DNA invertase Pin-like site-specific DNA recombinase
MKTRSTTSTTVAYSYLRFSSAAQTDGDSIRRQTAMRDAWLKRHPDVHLDTSLQLEDRGVSGYSGRHRKDGKHALAHFLDLVERGRVPVGSYLIVENLDRLTREDPKDSIPMVLNLIKAGVRVVQLAPAEMVYDPDMDFGRLMMMLWELSRGHGESARKSNLAGAVWGEKKHQARNGKKAHGKAVPAWLELNGGDGYRVKEDAGAAVRRIFQLSREGLGTLAIAARLDAEGVPPIARGRRWLRSYVAKILDNRAVLGEYQPMRGHHPRKPDGEPVPGYFPAVITEVEWHAAHAAAQNRNKRSGRPGKKGDYLHGFSGLLRCALDDCPLHVITRRGVRYVASGAAIQGFAGSHWRQFPLEVLVSALLSQLRELRSSQLFADPGAEKVTVLTGKLDEVEKRLAVAVAKFDADPESPTWAERVDKYDREKRALVKEKKAAEMEAANPASASWAEAVQQMQQMAAQEPQRLRAALLATVESVSCLFVPRGTWRLAAVQVHFKGGAERSYLIVHQKAIGGAVGTRPAHTSVCSLASVAKRGDLDLRRRADAGDLEALLAGVSLARLQDAMADASK